MKKLTYIIVWICCLFSLSFLGCFGNFNNILEDIEIQVFDSIYKTYDTGLGADVIGNVDISPDGQKIIVCGEDKLQLYNVESGLINSITAHTGNINDCMFLPNGTEIVSVSSDNVGKLWSATNLGLIRSYTGSSYGLYDVEYMPLADKILSTTQDKRTRFWDKQTGTLTNTITSSTSDFSEVTISPTEKYFVNNFVNSGSLGFAILSPFSYEIPYFDYFYYNINFTISDDFVIGMKDGFDLYRLNRVDESKTVIINQALIQKKLSKDPTFLNLIDNITVSEDGLLTALVTLDGGIVILNSNDMTPTHFKVLRSSDVVGKVAVSNGHKMVACNNYFDHKLQVIKFN